jgi:hypothetical protein
MELLTRFLEENFWPIYALVAAVVAIAIVSCEVKGFGWTFRGYFVAKSSQQDKAGDGSDGDTQP